MLQSKPCCSVPGKQLKPESWYNSKGKSPARPIKSDNGYIIIDKHVLPLIFQFNLKCTKTMKLSNDDQMPTIGRYIFQFVINHASTYRLDDQFHTRMKNQEKIKFLIRNFENRYALFHSIKAKKPRRFDLAAVQQFFERPEVKQQFLRHTFWGLVEKKEHNDLLKLELQQLIIQCLLDDDGTELGFHKAQLVFTKLIKNRQLPWYSEMYLDMLQYSRRLYLTYANPSQQEKERVHNLPLGSNLAWESTQNKKIAMQIEAEGIKY